jgi:hypothetical protein
MRATAMLAEKARREAVVKQSSTTDHSVDANKMVKQPDACALLRRFIDAVVDDLSDTKGSMLWDLRREAISLLDQVPDHSPDAGKMAELENVKKDLAQALDEGVWIQAANRELAEALKALLDCISETRGKNASVAVMNARAILTKHKATK